MEATQPNPAVFKVRRQTQLERFDASERGRRLAWLEAKRVTGAKLSAFQRESYRALIAARREIAFVSGWPERDRAKGAGA